MSTPTEITTIGTSDGMKHVISGLSYAEAVRVFNRTEGDGLVQFIGIGGVSLVKSQITWIMKDDRR